MTGVQDVFHFAREQMHELASVRIQKNKSHNLATRDQQQNLTKHGVDSNDRIVREGLLLAASQEEHTSFSVSTATSSMLANIDNNRSLVQAFLEGTGCSFEKNITVRSSLIQTTSSR